MLLVTHIDHFVIYCESQAFVHYLSSVLLLKLLWITSISAWAIERATIEIIVNHKHFCVSYRACYYCNYCESQTFFCDLSSVLQLKLLWNTIIWLWLIERVTVEIIVNHNHLVLTYCTIVCESHKILCACVFIEIILEYGFVNLHIYIELLEIFL